MDSHATAAGQDFRQWAPFPIAMAATPMVAAAAGDATCTGSAAAPTAPAGKVCVYTYVANNATLQVFPSPQAAGTHGFVVGVSSLAAGDTFAIGSWAVSDPLTGSDLRLARYTPPEASRTTQSRRPRSP